jgi:hypothetical protein
MLVSTLSESSITVAADWLPCFTYQLHPSEKYQNGFFTFLAVGMYVVRFFTVGTVPRKKTRPPTLLADQILLMSVL